MLLGINGSLIGHGRSDSRDQAPGSLAKTMAEADILASALGVEAPRSRWLTRWFA
jgi:hypothetical protein